MGNGVAEGVVDNSSTKFDAAVRHVTETIMRRLSASSAECPSWPYLTLVSCTAMSFRYVSFGQLSSVNMHDELPYGSAEIDGKAHPSKSSSGACSDDASLSCRIS